MKKTPLFLLVLLVASVGEAQSVGGKDAFQLSQAVAEMRRVISQVDVLQNNQDDLSTRLSGIEAAKNEIDSLRSEVAALRSEIDALRRELNAQQGRIIDDLTKKLVKMQPVETPRKTTPQKTVVYDGPCVEYTVEKGDTLSIIAKAFETSVQQIKDINGLKSDNIGVGKVLKVPAPKK